MKHFCTAGPVKPDLHYLIPPLERLDRDEVLSLIDQQKYFGLHAPPADRQDKLPVGACG
jgi:hypothetical protein